MKKNILYIAHGSQDFLDDSVFCGLKDHTEKYNIDYVMAGCQFYPPPIIRNDEDRDKFIEQRMGVDIYDFKYDWAKTAKLLGSYNETKLYDAIILGSAWIPNQEKFKEVSFTLKPEGKVAVIDGCDHEHGLSRPDVNINIPYHILFRSNHCNDTNWKTSNYLPFATPNDLAARANPKSLDFVINCQMGTTNKCRTKTVEIVWKACQELDLLDKSKFTLWDQDWNKPNPRLSNSLRTPLNEFWDILERSKIIFCDAGRGTESYRVWEAMAAGNFVLLSPNQMVYKNNNVPLPENVIYWKDYEHLKKILKILSKASDAEVYEMRVRAKEFIGKHHLPKHRAQRVLRSLERAW